MRTRTTVVGIVVLMGGLGRAYEARAAGKAASKAQPDVQRSPYSAGAVYRLRLAAGAPCVIELPAGETAKNIWFDGRWWAAESTPGSSRVVVRALGSSEVVGKRGVIHIETDPSDLRISLKVEAVSEDADALAALEIYREGRGTDPVKQEVKK
jgi:hypothetical protein